MRSYQEWKLFKEEEQNTEQETPIQKLINVQALRKFFPGSLGNYADKTLANKINTAIKNELSHLDIDKHDRNIENLTNDQFGELINIAKKIIATGLYVVFDMDGSRNVKWNKIQNKIKEARQAQAQPAQAQSTQTQTAQTQTAQTQPTQSYPPQ